MENNSTNPSMRGSGVSLLKVMLVLAGVLLFIGIAESVDNANDRKAQEVERARIAATPIEIKLAEVSSSTKAFHIEDYVTSTTRIGEAAKLFDQWASVLTDALSATSTEAVKQRDALTKEVKRIQADAFPQLRKAFGVLMAKKVMIEDMEVSTSGAKYERISLVSVTFAVNRNIAETQAAIENILTKLRFKRAEYRWTRNANDWKFLDLETKQDQDL